MDKDYTENLSLWKHRVIKRYAQQELGRQVNQHALVLAKARLQQFITEEMRLTRTIRSRHSMARWWNEEVTTWINEATQADSASSTCHTVDTSPEGGKDPTSEQEQQGVAHKDGALCQPLPSTHAPTPSVADLCAPLPSFHEPVALLPDPGTQETQTPFESFPPLPGNDRSPLDKPRRTRRGPNKTTSHNRRSTAAPARAPGQRRLPRLPTQEPEPQDRTAAPDQHPTSDPQATHSPEMTATIHERQQSFGIAVRSTPWR